MSEIDKLLKAGNSNAPLKTAKKKDTIRVGIYGITQRMREFIEEDMDEKLSSYILRALKKQLKEDGYVK